MEQTDGDADMAREVAQSMLDDKVAELEQAQEQSQREPQEEEGQSQETAYVKPSEHEGKFGIGDKMTFYVDGKPFEAEVVQTEDVDGVVVQTSERVNGHLINQYTREELDALTTPPQQANDNADVARPQAPEAGAEVQNETEEEKSPDELPAFDGDKFNETHPADEIRPTEEQKPNEENDAVDEASAASKVPQDESGEYDYMQAEPSKAWAALLEQTDGDADMAREVAQSMLDDKVAELEQAQKQKPKEGKSVAEKIAARKEHKANIERIEKEIEQWQQILSQSEQTPLPKQKTTKETIANNGEKVAEPKAKHNTEQTETPKEETPNTDNQGNPLNEDGTLKVDKVKSIDELTDEDFNSPARSVQLPQLPQKVDEAIGANGKPVVIKKSIFEKNKKAHKDLTPEQSREILHDALFETDLYGQNQKYSRPYNWILIHNAKKHSSVIIEVNHNKDNTEIVNWHYLDDVALEQKKRQAVKEGGLILTLESAAGNTHNNLSPESKDTKSKAEGQEKSEESKETSLSEQISTASAEVNTNPTEAQKEAGNYKKGHVQVGTFDITIEQPQGSIRRGKDANGKKWESKMHNTYGYFRGTEGVDGDQIDVFLSNDIDGWNGRKVFVVDQYNPDGTFDEHKVMLGFNDIDEAKSDYLANYEKGLENGRRIDVTPVSLEDFEKWIGSSHRKTKAFAEYAGVKKETEEKPLSEKGGKVPFHKAGESNGELTKAEVALRDAVIDRLRENGIDVVTDVSEGQRVLDMANGNGEETRLMSVDERKERIEQINKISPERVEDKPTTRKEARSAYAELKPVEKDGATVEFYNSAFGKAWHGEDCLFGKIIPKIREIFKSSVLAYSETDNLGGKQKPDGTIHKKHPNIKAFHNYVGKVIIGNKPYYVRFTVQEGTDAKQGTHNFFVSDISLYNNTVRNVTTDTNNTLGNTNTDGIVDAKLKNFFEMSDGDGQKFSYHRVYHGSGADFSFFDHDHMGDGEGTQAHGWGTYVAVREETAKGYAQRDAEEKNGEKSILKWYGSSSSVEEIMDYLEENYPDTFGEWLYKKWGNTYRVKLKGVLDTIRYGNEYDVETLKDELYHIQNDYNYSDEEKEFYNEVKDKVLPYVSAYKPYAPNLYAVEIPNNNNQNYIEEYKDYGARTKLRRSVEKGLKELGIEGLGRDAMTGRDIYDVLIAKLGSKEKTSKFLEDLGIVGVHYYGMEDGECYVIFNEGDAKIVDKVRFFKTQGGEAYGFTVGGKIYIDPHIASSETAVHEYAHLWAEALRSANAKEWENVVGLMRGTSVWNEVSGRYPELKSDDEIADEVLATYSGRRGSERLREEMDRIKGSERSVADKARALGALERVRRALDRFWHGVADFLGIHYKSADEVADRVMRDLLNGVDPRRLAQKKVQNDIVQRENPMLDDYHTGIRSEDDIHTFAEAVSEAQREKEKYGDEQMSSYPDITDSLLNEAIKTGKITIYSSKPIKDGVFVTPSRMQAQDYAGGRGAKVYSKEVSIESVAWIDVDEGQFAEVKNAPMDKIRFQYIGEMGAEGADRGEQGRSLRGDEALTALNRIFDGEVKDELPPTIPTIEKFRQIFSKPIRTFLGELIKVKDNVYNKIQKEKRTRVSGAVMPTIKNADFAMRDTDGSTLYIKRFNNNTSDSTYNIAVVNKHGEVEDYISSVHIKRDANLRNKIKNGAELLLPNKRNGDGTVSRNNSTPDAKLGKISEKSDANGTLFRDDVDGVVSSSGVDGMRERAVELGRELGADVDVVSDVSEITDPNPEVQERKRRAKGWYDAKTGRVVINLAAHSDMADVEQTLLHEIVGHRGLRGLVGHENFNGFLDGIYEHASDGVREGIDDIARRKGCSKRVATEEYMSGLAEGGFADRKNAGLWQQIRQWFSDMLSRAKIKLNFSISDNELRYLLWRSHELSRMNGREGVVGRARDLAMQNRLGVGNGVGVLSRSNNSETNVAEINNTFNKELQQQIDGKLPNGHIYRMGKPGRILLSTGVPNLPIQMSAKRLQEKATMFDHDFKLSEVKNLVLELQHPLAVFEYGDKSKAQNIVVSLQQDGKNFIVGLSLNPMVNGNNLEINSIRNVFPKDNSEWLNWIGQGKSLYLDKEKVQNLIDQQRTNLADVDYLDLDSITKVIENFENPKVSDGKRVVDSYDGDLETLFRDADSPVDYERALIRDSYERRLKDVWFQSREALQDGMLSLKETMKDIWRSAGKKFSQITDIPDYANPYLGQNRLSSRNAAEVSDFKRRLFRPLLREVGRLTGFSADGRAKLTDYMMAKHGLERNKVMAERDAKAAYEAEKLKDPNTTKTLADFVAEYRKKDYSGLTSLTGLDDVAAAEAEAKNMVADYEANHDTANLWARTKAVTDAIVQKQYDSGYINSITRNAILNMYDNYIPLRGFEDKTAEDVYSYMKHSNSAFNAPIKTARGRKSKADDPFANMLAMAESGIMRGNRNKLVKLPLLSLVLEHPTDLISVSDVWFALLLAMCKF